MIEWFISYVFPIIFVLFFIIWLVVFVSIAYFNFSMFRRSFKHFRGFDKHFENFDKRFENISVNKNDSKNYACSSCGSKLGEKADVSPSGDVRCQYCNKWFNIHKN